MRIGQLGTAMATIGIDAGRVASLRNLARFWRERRAFIEQGGRIDRLRPILFDYADSSGVANGHYFHQDLLVAQFVHAAAPAAHVDIGSRIDGFVAHVAAFRPIDVIDIRPLGAGAHPNIRFVQADLMRPLPALAGRYPSVSCLHALEHFGLGRYTDPISVDGHRAGFEAILSLVAPGGILYLSVPVGRRRVEFNAQRVFDPGDVLEWSAGRLALERFDLVDDAGDLRPQCAVADAAGLRYGCGIYSLRRSMDPA